MQSFPWCFLILPNIFFFPSYFHGKLTWRWATVELAGRTTRAHYESVGFIKNIASLAQHFNVTESRQDNVCFPLSALRPPCSIWVSVFAFSSVLLEFHLLRMANESFGGAIKRAESICHLQCLSGSSVVHKFQIHFYVLPGWVRDRVQSVVYEPLTRILPRANRNESPSPSPSPWHSVPVPKSKEKRRKSHTKRATRKEKPVESLRNVSPPPSPVAFCTLLQSEWATHLVHFPAQRSLAAYYLFMFMLQKRKTDSDPCHIPHAPSSTPLARLTVP